MLVNIVIVSCFFYVIVIIVTDRFI